MAWWWSAVTPDGEREAGEFGEGAGDDAGAGAGGTARTPGAVIDGHLHQAHAPAGISAPRLRRGSERRAGPGRSLKAQSTSRKDIPSTISTSAVHAAPLKARRGPSARRRRRPTKPSAPASMGSSGGSWAGSNCPSPSVMKTQRAEEAAKPARSAPP
jgi:hypothetical protein